MDGSAEGCGFGLVIGVLVVVLLVIAIDELSNK
jgi:hypothetical protein